MTVRPSAPKMRDRRWRMPKSSWAAPLTWKPSTCWGRSSPKSLADRLPSRSAMVVEVLSWSGCRRLGRLRHGSPRGPGQVDGVSRAGRRLDEDRAERLVGLVDEVVHLARGAATDVAHGQGVAVSAPDPHVRRPLEDDERLVAELVDVVGHVVARAQPQDADVARRALDDVGGFV